MVGCLRTGINYDGSHRDFHEFVFIFDVLTSSLKLGWSVFERPHVFQRLQASSRVLEEAFASHWSVLLLAQH